MEKRIERGIVPLVIVAFLLSGPPAYAKSEGDKEKQQSKGPTTFGVSPPGLDLEGSPGEKITAIIKIDNPLSVASNYDVVPMGFVATKAGLINKPLSSLPADHLSRNITFDSATVSVPPRSFKKVNIHITIPPTAQGTQYAGVIVSRLSGNENPLDRSTEYERHMGLGMQPALGIKIRVAMKGSISFGIKLDAVRVQHATASRPATATATILNTGTGELRINPILILVDSHGGAGIRMRSESNMTIIPGGKSDIPFVSAGRDIPAGTYKAILTIPDAKYQLPPSELSVSIK